MRIINILRRRVKVTGMVLLMSTSAPCAYADWVPDLQSYCHDCNGWGECHLYAPAAAGVR